MAVQITIDQATMPGGSAGVAREDLILGKTVTLKSSGGPFISQLWRIIHKPIDIVAGTRATSLLATPTAANSTLAPIDVAGTYLVELAVDSGSGLGATAADVKRITFYAGPTLSTIQDDCPRRPIAFNETIEHNVPDAIEAGGNTEGWSREWYRWFAVIKKLATSGGGGSWAKVSLPAGGPAVVSSGYNIAAVNRFGMGVVDVTFTAALANNRYAVLTGVHGSGGSCLVVSETVNGFRIERSDPFGVLVDDNFSFDVKVGP